MKVVYEPAPEGRAGEYTNKYAANFFRGCGHGCEYCFAPLVLKMKKDEFFENPKIRHDGKILEEFIKDLEFLRRNEDKGEIFMSFTCDPYQPIEEETKITREAIVQMGKRGQPFSILTKGGKRSERDFDLLSKYSDRCRYGVTLVFASDEDSLKYEPKAAPTSERIEVLARAKALGIKTWVSIEPAWSWEDTENIILRTRESVDEYRFGKLNYHAHSKEVDWVDYKKRVVELCEFLDVNYILKKDLAVL